MTGSHEVDGSIPFSSTMGKQGVSHLWLAPFYLDCAVIVKLPIQ